MIIIVTACVVTAAVIAAVVIITCLVLHRRHKLDADNANRRRTAMETDSKNRRVIEMNNTKSADKGQQTMQNAHYSHVEESATQIGNNHGIIKQPFTVEPKVKGIRI